MNRKPSKASLQETDPEPRIIFEDAHLVVLSKPAGLLSQSDKSKAKSLVDWLRFYLTRHYVGLVHRLDRNISGIMVVAKRTKAARRLTQALQDGKINRSYLGWIVGEFEKEEKWRHWLVKDKSKNQVRVVLRKSVGAKEAVLNARPLKKSKWKGKSLTLVSFSLETGRSHQIRVQCAYEGFPLLGDPKYGSGLGAFGRPALHSSEITFPHPMSGEILKFEDPLPGDMSAI